MHLLENPLPSNIGHVHADFIPQRIPIYIMYLSMVRTLRFSGGAEGGTEVEWLDGYSPEITILCLCSLLLEAIHWIAAAIFASGTSGIRLPHPRCTQTVRIGILNIRHRDFNSANIANRWRGLLRPPINCLKSPRIKPCVSNL